MGRRGPAAMPSTLLRALLADVSVDDAGLLALLGDLRGSDPKAGLTHPDEVPEPPAEPYVKPGELYRLGDHRILCGDATIAGTWPASWPGRPIPRYSACGVVAIQ